MVQSKSDQVPALRVPCDPWSAEALDKEIRAALDQAGVEVSGPKPWSYQGRPIGALGLTEGWVAFVGDAWQDLMRVPKAVEAVARGFARWMIKERVTARYEKRPDGTVVIELKASATGLDEAELVAQFVKSVTGA